MDIYCLVNHHPVSYEDALARAHGMLAERDPSRPVASIAVLPPQKPAHDWYACRLQDLILKDGLT